MAGFTPGTALFARKNIGLNEQTDDYTLTIADDGRLVDMNKGTAVTLTIPPGSSAAFPVGAQVLVRQKGAGQVTVSPAAGVTLNLISSEDKTEDQNAMLALIKIATNTWVLSGRSAA